VFLRLQAGVSSKLPGAPDPALPEMGLIASTAARPLARWRFKTLLPAGPSRLRDPLPGRVRFTAWLGGGSGRFCKPNWIACWRGTFASPGQSAAWPNISATRQPHLLHLLRCPGLDPLTTSSERAIRLMSDGSARPGEAIVRSNGARTQGGGGGRFLGGASVLRTSGSRAKTLCQLVNLLRFCLVQFLLGSFPRRTPHLEVVLLTSPRSATGFHPVSRPPLFKSINATSCADADARLAIVG